jgi:hypothetical protein
VDAETIAARIREDHAEWQALREALDALPEGSLHDPNSPTWTSRDVYAHLAHWIEHSTSQLEAYLAGRPLSRLEGTDDQVNARWHDEDAKLTMDEARAWAQRAFGERLLAIEKVPLDLWEDRIIEATAFADGAEHYRNHRLYITA